MTDLEVNDDSGDKDTEALQEVSQDVYEGSAHVDVLPMVVMRTGAGALQVHVVLLLVVEHRVAAAVRVVMPATAVAVPVLMQRQAHSNTTDCDSF